MTSLSTRPSAVQSLRRVLSDDGFFLVCAIDHLDDFDVLLGTPGPARDAAVVREKARLVEVVAPVVSAVLLDPVAGIPGAFLTGAAPTGVGVIAPIEEEDYGHPAEPRTTLLREGWNAERARAAGADMAKLLWFYRPDLDARIAEAQRDLLARLSQDVRDAGLTSVVEPIWFATRDEDPADPDWRERRAEGIVTSALTAAELGADVLKVEFPGDIADERQRTAAATRCRRLTDELGVPWVLLSAGVTLSDFERQLRIACEHGASGYMAGRSIWRDAVGDPGRDREVAARLARLNEIVRASGRSAFPATTVEDAIALRRDWYRTSTGQATL